MNVTVLAASKGSIDEVKDRYAGAKTREERAILTVAEALENGAKVVSLRHVLAGGYKRPNVAVAPPWAKTVKLRVFNGHSRYRTIRLSARRGFKRWSVTVPKAVQYVPDRKTARAMVPPVPPKYQGDVRPGTLVLFEVEEWAVKPPRDPALLHPVDRRSRDDFYELGPEWDLTLTELVALGA